MPVANCVRFLLEIRLSHRDVQVSIDGVDSNGILFASVRNPASKEYIGKELLRTSLAKTVSCVMDRSHGAQGVRQLSLWMGFQAVMGARQSFAGKLLKL